MVETKVLPSSQVRTIAALVIASGFVALAIFLPNDGSDQTWRWWCGGLFGLGLVILPIMLIRPQRVALDTDGFAISGGFARAPKRIAWRDVVRFYPLRLPRGGTVVAYVLDERARSDRWLGKLSRAFGADGMLPRTLRGSPAALADELNAYRARALAG